MPTPAFVSDTVRDGVSVGLAIYPDATADMTKAATVVCAAASASTNLVNINPGNLVAAMQAAGVTNQNAKIIASGVIVVWNRVWAYFEPGGLTNTAVISDYANSLCTGMKAGLPPTGAMATAKKRALPPHL